MSKKKGEKGYVKNKKSVVIYVLLLFVTCCTKLLINTKTVRADGNWYNPKSQKITAKKAGWYLLKNSSKSSKACQNIFVTKKKNGKPEEALPTCENYGGGMYRIEKGKSVKLYLNKGTYYIGQEVYPNSIVNRNIKVKYVGKVIEISDKKSVDIQGDVKNKNILLKFKATKTGTIRIGTAYGRNEYYITLCNSKGKAISGKNKIYKDKDDYDHLKPTHDMGVSKGKTYYLKVSGLKRRDVQGISVSYSSYYGNSNYNWVSGGSKKISATNLIEGLNAGYIGLTSGVEEQWYKYTYSQPVGGYGNGRIRLDVLREELCWTGVKANKFNIEIYNSEGNRITVEEDEYGTFSFNNMGTTYVRITVGKGSPTAYKLYVEQR